MIQLSPRSCRHPVKKPAPSAPIFSNPRPQEANLDIASVEDVFTQERADTCFEGAAHRNIDGRRAAAVDPPDRPLSRRRIEGPQRGGAIGAAGQFNHIVIDIAEPAKDRAHLACPAKHVPVRVALQALLQPSMTDVPASEEEIEIGPPI
ncbi:hypothetical protein [Mesorhizobium sp.]|uniref:hypothetical protein n=1 Tax=Mesorhizobium sp. TaxID=1871066 RepID=UPI00257A3810|nr:hypothetical protein [Mesorhizobium sp.]